MEIQCFVPYNGGQKMSFVKFQMVLSLGFAGQVVSIETSQPCCQDVKAAQTMYKRMSRWEW